MDGAKINTTPLSTSTTLVFKDNSQPADAIEYCCVIRSLPYLSLTRLDIFYAVNKLSQFMHSPSQTHWAAIKILLRYLKHTLHHGLFLHRQCPLILHGFSNSDWGVNRDDRTSTIVFVLYLGKNPISWCSKKQRTVPHSFTEVEYRVVASTTAEVNWVQSLLKELHVTLPSPPARYCDNVGATYVCANWVFYSRMKHIAIDYHFVRDQMSKGLLRV